MHTTGTIELECSAAQLLRPGLSRHRTLQKPQLRTNMDGFLCKHDAASCHLFVALCELAVLYLADSEKAKGCMGDHRHGGSAKGCTGVLPSLGIT